jgi:hypothetical protein
MQVEALFLLPKRRFLLQSFAAIEIWNFADNHPRLITVSDAVTKIAQRKHNWCHPSFRMSREMCFININQKRHEVLRNV